MLKDLKIAAGPESGSDSVVVLLRILAAVSVQRMASINDTTWLILEDRHVKYVNRLNDYSAP